MGVAGVGRIRHQNANKSDRDELIRQMYGLDTTLPGGDLTVREGHPCSLGGGAEGISSGPILDKIASRVGGGPVDPDGVDIFVIAQVDDGPLGMNGIGFAGESGGEVGIAFPVR